MKNLVLCLGLIGLGLNGIGCVEVQGQQVPGDRDQALFDALNKGVEAVRDALDAGANIDAKNANGHTPLDMASMGVRLWRTSFQKTVAAVGEEAARESATARIFADAVEIMNLLRERGGSTRLEVHADRSDLDDVAWWFGSSVHDLALGERRSELSEALMFEKNVDRFRDGYGRTPLHYAALTGDEDVVDILLDHGATINAVDNNHRTPLDMLNERIEKCKNEWKWKDDHPRLILKKRLKEYLLLLGAKSGSDIKN